MNRGGRAEVTPPENLIAVEMFDHFCAAGTMKQILALHREICHTLTLVPNRLPEYYPKLKDKLARSWKAQALFKKFDARANHKVYAKGRAGAASKVLIIGAGPCGLRAAIECQLLGAKVVVIEKRDRMSRNNVLHLWPFVIEDLRALGAKKFFGKFCAGSIDHISIRQLQCILLKVALLLGVEFHEGVSFEGLLEPTITVNSDTLGWRASVTPSHQPVSQYEFDVLLGADGKRNTLHGFQRKEFRGKLAMAITANFINRNTEQEAAVPEINGVAFIFNQKFFKDLYEQTGIDLENIVYYKDDTHYFVMTAKKHSLLDKGVLLNDYSEVSRLLSVRNVDREALMRYAREAARFSTEGRLPLRDFALNHYGEPDVALFDFTSMYMAINASMVRERFGRRLLCQLVGDSLLEPFWPTGSGCARGFLSALDAVWAVRSWSQSPPPHPLELIAERESTYRLLAQTTVENLNRDLSAYTLDPCTRYRNLNRATVSPHQVTAFYVSDDPLPLDETPSVRKRRRDAAVSDDALLAWMGGACGDFRAAVTPAALAALLRRYRPDLLPAGAAPKAVFAVIQHEFGLPQLSAGRSPGDVPEAEMRSYLARLYDAFKGEVPHVYHPSDVFDQIKEKESKQKASRSAILTPSMFSNTSDAEKSHSSNRKKRRAVRQVSVIEDIRDRKGQLDLCNVSNVPVNEMSNISISDVSYVPGNESFNANLNDSKIPGHQMSPLSNEANNPGSEMFNASTNDLSIPGREISTASISEVSNFSALFENQCSPMVKVTRIVDFSDIPSNQSTQFQGNGSSTPKHNQWPKADLDDYFEVLFAEPVRPARKPKKVRKISPRQLNYYSDILKMSPGPLGEILQISTPDSNDVSPPKKIVNTPASCTPKRLRRPSDAREGTFGRSNSIGSLDVSSGDRAPVLDRRFSQDSRSRRSGSVSDLEMAIRRRRFWELIEGKQTETPNPRFKSPVACGTPVAVRIERVANLLVPKSPDRPKYSTRRRASREMRQQIERAQKLAAVPQEVIPSADLENDYGLQQYRANAPHFGDRVKDLQMKLQHHEEGRIVGGGGRSIGTGDRVARLAAELSGNATNPAATPRVASKPKDLMRSVGKIERDDWNVKKIENKIMENRLGRPEPKSAEKVPKWDREQFLGRQRRLKEGDAGDEKWGEIDEALLKFDQKRRDSGRPAHGTKKVASLATKFVKKDEPENTAPPPKEELKKSWRGPASTGVRCAACGARVFAAEGVLADGLHLHRACFRCAVCKAVLRPGNYTTERNGTRLVCLRHGGVSVPDAAALSHAGAPLPPPTPERISVELSDTGAREIDEDEWTDRNCLASETSCAGGLSDDDESSSGEYADADAADSDCGAPETPAAARDDVPVAPRSLYFSDDSFGYDDYSDDGALSSGGESCSRMRAAREARRREVPADAPPPTDSSEVESEAESESTDEVSSATEVSTDSEFAREECLPAPSPPAILVTEAPPPAPPPPQDYPLSRTRSAGGLATKRALELKRRYLLGEPSPPAVRKSESTSQLDTKLEAFRFNITEFQKMLHPAPLPTPQPQKPIVTFQLSTDKKIDPMPDIIQNLRSEVPVDLLTKADSPPCKKEWVEETIKEENKEPEELESDSLSDDDSSHTETVPNQAVPRVEVHDEGGELIQLDSLMLIDSGAEDNDEKASGTATNTGPTVVSAESESSESCRDITTLALTETELSDWAAESAVLDDCNIDDKDDKKRSKNPRTLSGPKTIHDAKNISAISSHVCGRTSPTEAVVYSNALEHFEFVDEGDQDPSIETPGTPRNEGYMELVDDEYDPFSPSNDRSMNFIERSFSETMILPTSHDASATINERIEETSSEAKIEETLDLSSQVIDMIDKETSEKSSSDSVQKSDAVIRDIDNTSKIDDTVTEFRDTFSLSELSPPLEKDCTESIAPPKVELEAICPEEDASPPLAPETPQSVATTTSSNVSVPLSTPCTMRLHSPAICRSASETFNRSTSRSTDSPRSIELSMSINLSSGSVSPVSPTPLRNTTDKVQELKREREEQTEVVRRLVLERLGSGPRVARKSARRARISPSSNIPPPVPPPPSLPTPPPPPPPPVIPSPPPRPAPPLMPLPVTPSFSDPELARERRRKSIMRSISNYLNRRLGPRHKEPPAQPRISNAHKSTGALQEAPPVPPPPACYRPPVDRPPPVRHTGGGSGAVDVDERDAMQLWFEARWARLVAQRRAREEPVEPHARRVARLERRLTRPLSAEQQAATVAELVQVSAQREAHQALMAANRRRSGVSD